MYILTCISCQDCGSQSVGLFVEKPTEEEISKTEELIGGMTCIVSMIYRLEAGEITAKQE